MDPAKGTTSQLGKTLIHTRLAKGCPQRLWENSLNNLLNGCPTLRGFRSVGGIGLTSDRVEVYMTKNTSGQPGEQRSQYALPPRKKCKREGHEFTRAANSPREACGLAPEVLF
jgi:hypothetical protein